MSSSNGNRGRVARTIDAFVDWQPVVTRTVYYGTISCALGPWTPGHSASRWAMKAWCRSSTRALGIDVSVSGTLPGGGQPSVLVANHASMLDIIVLGSVLDLDYRWLAKSGVFLVPFMGWHLRLAGHVPVYRGDNNKDRNRDLPTQLHRVIDSGASLLFFPEGTRTKDGQLQPFKIGAFMAAARENVPVVPLLLRGTGDLMEKGTASLTKRSARHSSVTGLAPIPCPTEGDTRAKAEAMRDAAWKAMAHELGQSEAAPAHP